MAPILYASGQNGHKDPYPLSMGTDIFQKVTSTSNSYLRLLLCSCKKAVTERPVTAFLQPIQIVPVFRR